MTDEQSDTAKRDVEDLERQRHDKGLDGPLTSDHWTAVTATQWHQLLDEAWSKRCMSLSAAVHWIATCGAYREADYDELEDASRKLLDAAREEGGRRLRVFGRRPSAEQQEELSPLALRGDWSFFGDPADFESNPGGNKPAPLLIWNPMLEQQKEDKIVRQDGSADVWLGLNVDRISLQAIWPARICEDDMRRPRGRPADVQNKIVNRMLIDLRAGSDLSTWTRDNLHDEYQASPGTCMKARDKALKIFRAGNPDNS